MRILSLTHLDRHGKTTTRKVDPIPLAHTNGHWYLVAHCRLAGSPLVSGRPSRQRERDQRARFFHSDRRGWRSTVLGGGAHRGLTGAGPGRHRRRPTTSGRVCVWSWGPVRGSDWGEVGAEPFQFAGAGAAALAEDEYRPVEVLDGIRREVLRDEGPGEALPGLGLVVVLAQRPEHDHRVVEVPPCLRVALLRVVGLTTRDEYAGVHPGVWRVQRAKASTGLVQLHEDAFEVPHRVGDTAPVEGGQRRSATPVVWISGGGHVVVQGFGAVQCVQRVAPSPHSVQVAAVEFVGGGAHQEWEVECRVVDQRHGASQLPARLLEPAEVGQGSGGERPQPHLRGGVARGARGVGSRHTRRGPVLDEAGVQVEGGREFGQPPRLGVKSLRRRTQDQGPDRVAFAFQPLLGRDPVPGERVGRSRHEGVHVGHAESHSSGCLLGEPEPAQVVVDPANQDGAAFRRTIGLVGQGTGMEAQEVVAEPEGVRLFPHEQTGVAQLPQRAGGVIGVDVAVQRPRQSGVDAGAGPLAQSSVEPGGVLGQRLVDPVEHSTDAGVRTAQFGDPPSLVGPLGRQPR
ncbi:hypothetical protein J4H86_12445 [Spiractinospora alimapuensis]|nr:hypothetical protein J4H86_12445 [Spiractinospora alimapuensis]